MLILNVMPVSKRAGQDHVYNSVASHSFNTVFGCSKFIFLGSFPFQNLNPVTAISET